MQTRRIEFRRTPIHPGEMIKEKMQRGCESIQLGARKVSARPTGNVKALHDVHAEFHARALFPPVDFIVTNLALPSRAVVRFYNKRTTVEQWIKEGKLAVNWTRLSWHRFRGNEVRL